MHHHNLLFAAFATALLVAVLHITALRYLLYFYFYWFDIPVHFLGGVFIALATAWVVLRLGYRISIPLCILTALYVGILWEVFEYTFNIPQTYWISYPFDTVKDIVMDTVGGAIGGLLANFLVRNDTMS